MSKTKASSFKELGTSAKVEGRAKYPPFFSFLRHALRDFKGTFLLALCTVYIFHPLVATPIVEVAKSGAATQFLETNTIMIWLRNTFFGAEVQAQGKNLTEAMVFVICAVILHAVCYTTINGFFGLSDALGLFQSYKMPRRPEQQPSRRLILRCLREAFVNQAFFGPITTLLLYRYVVNFQTLFKYGPDPNTPAVAVDAPDLFTTWLQLLAASFCNEILFYIAHRAFHEVPGFYVRFHKQHHHFTGTMGIAAEYAHPLEQMFANQIPTVFYCVAFSHTMPVTVFWAWLIFRLLETYEAHSGFNFSPSFFGKIGLTFGDRCEFHDFHHTKNCGNYGVWWIDYLCGTMDAFLIHKEQQQKEKKK